MGWMTAIGCGGEEGSSGANGFCYQWLAAGKPIKKWKRHWALKQILCGTHFASQSGRRERCGCLQNGLKSTTKFPEEKWESLLVPHSECFCMLFLAWSRISRGLMLHIICFMLKDRTRQSNDVLLYLVLIFIECQLVNLWGDLVGLSLCSHLSNVSKYCVTPLLFVFTQLSLVC